MSVKLSELLEAAGASLSKESRAVVAAWGHRDPVHGQEWTAIANERAFRAIAPALVEFVGASEALEKADDESTSFLPVVAASRAAEKALMRLRAAMKEAGVTCE